MKQYFIYIKTAQSENVRVLFYSALILNSSITLQRMDLWRILRKNIENVQFSQPDRRKDAENTVQMVIDYIRLNYNNDITLKDLAENVFS